MNTTLAFFHHLNNIFHAFCCCCCRSFLSFHSLIHSFIFRNCFCFVTFDSSFAFFYIKQYASWLFVYQFTFIYTQTQLCGSDIREIRTQIITIFCHYLQHACMLTNCWFLVLCIHLVFSFSICSLIRLLNAFTECFKLWNVVDVCFEHSTRKT